MKKNSIQTLVQVFVAMVFSVCIFSTTHGGIMSVTQDEIDSDAAIGKSNCAALDFVNFNIDVLEPGLPISISDAIRLRALSVGYVFGSTAFYTNTFFDVSGFNISWHMYTFPIEEGGYAVMCQVEDIIELGPLPAGDYQVTATWVYSEDGFIKRSGGGVGNFSVVPEPSTFIMLLTAVFMVMCFGYKKIRVEQMP